MNENTIKFLKTAGAALVAIITVLSLHGETAIKALLGFPVLVQAISSGLPLGVWSVMIAFVVSMGAWAYLLHWLPNRKNGERPHFLAESLAILIAVIITTSQQWGASGGALLNAGWMGLAAGFASTYIGKGIQSLTAKKGK